MEREQRTIKGNEAYRIAGDWGIDNLDYEVVKRKLTDSDDEDGGGHYTLILKEKSTGKFFEYNFCDWDIYNTDYDEEDDTVGERCDLPTEIHEVFAKTKTTTVYK
jgi:hypothetical protein